VSIVQYLQVVVKKVKRIGCQPLCYVNFNSYMMNVYWPYLLRHGYCVENQYSSFKGFCPLKTRLDDSSYIGCKNIHIHLLTLCFLCHLLKCAPIPKWHCHKSITHKTKYETSFFKNGYGIHHTQNSCDSFNMWQCDWKHQIHMW
jgi:hypothetical protein